MSLGGLDLVIVILAAFWLGWRMAGVLFRAGLRRDPDILDGLNRKYGPKP